MICIGEYTNENKLKDCNADLRFLVNFTFICMFIIVRVNPLSVSVQNS